MKIAFTWDYELFFGEQSGSVEKCMLFPTNSLLDIAAKHEAKFTFFTDIGFLSRAEELNISEEENSLVSGQIARWDTEGHETGLHIHPHWEDACFENNQWKFDLKRYKLADFSNEEAEKVVLKYGSLLQEKVQQKITSYRAGGWCIQPFVQIAKPLKEIGICIESSVFVGGKNVNGPYAYDFTNAPQKESWKFEMNECVEETSGTFLEIPIAARNYSPLFFWKLFVLGRLFPSQHKPIGNGKPAAGGGSKKDLLTKSNFFCVSADGFFVTEIENAVKEAEKLGRKSIVIIGHPKACTPYSLRKLDAIIAKLKHQHQFVCLRDLAK